MKFAALARTQWLYDGNTAAVAAGHECVLICTAQAAPEYTRNETDFENLACQLGAAFVCDAGAGQSIHSTRQRLV